MVQSENYMRPKKAKPNAYILKYEKNEPRQKTMPPFIKDFNSNRKQAGMGWQKSRSVRDNDSSSDLCFSEETAMQRRGLSVGRPSSGNGEANSYYYCKECRKSKRRSPQRRKSADSGNRMAHSSSAQQCKPSAQPIPIQKRITTCPPPTCLPQCVCADDELIGYTHIRDAAFFEKEKANRQGPKPKKYIQKLNTDHKDEAFPKSTEEDDLRANCVKRHMNMLVKTGDFVEYGYCIDAEKTDDYETADNEEYEYFGAFVPKDGDPLKEIVEVVRVEFHQNRVDGNGELPGRVYLKTTGEVKVDCLKLNVSQTEMEFKSDGNTNDKSETTKVLLLPVKETDEEDDGKFRIKRGINRRLHLKPGSHAIHFTLVAQPKLEETFVKVSGETGEMAFNNYSVDLFLKLNDLVRETDRISFDVHSGSEIKQEQRR